MINKRNNKKGQVVIFVIIAIVLVAGILTYFLLRGTFNIDSGNPEIAKVYSYYSSCIEEEARSALDLAGSKGGHIYTENYIPGSEYAPFSNELNFFGFPVSYWYYLAGNGIAKEQVPSKTEIENDVARFIEEKIGNCNFQSFYDEGYFIDLEEAKAKVSIFEDNVKVEVNSELIVSKGDVSATKTSHNVEIQSKFGKLYNLAIEIYNKEKKDAFLENYGVDVLRLYAPVDGVEIECSPKIWKTRDVVDNLKDALADNLATIKFDGSYYSLLNKDRKYFVVNSKVDEPVSVLYSKGWPSRFEIYGIGAENELLVADPVGNQEGMGIMGFCYVPYHFVYDISFPVLFQIGDGTDLFQFPVAVVIDKNMPRNAVESETAYEPEFDLCRYYTQDIEISVSDISLNPIEANISFSCFNQKCSLGTTSNGRFIGKAPACANGYLTAKAGGYSDGKMIFSSNSENYADIILDKQYDIELSIMADGRAIDNTAVVSFIRNDGKVISAALPDVKNIKLSEGQYEVRVYIYGNSSIVIPATMKRQCTNVGKSGFLGLFGGTEERCFNIEIPETKIEYAILGGGKSNEYFLPSELQKGHLTIDAGMFGAPDSFEKLQNNLAGFDSQSVEVRFS